MGNVTGASARPGVSSAKDQQSVHQGQLSSRSDSAMLSGSRAAASYSILDKLPAEKQKGYAELPSLAKALLSKMQKEDSSIFLPTCPLTEKLQKANTTYQDPELSRVMYQQKEQLVELVNQRMEDPATMSKDSLVQKVKNKLTNNNTQKHEGTSAPTRVSMNDDIETIINAYTAAMGGLKGEDVMSTFIPVQIMAKANKMAKLCKDPKAAKEFIDLSADISHQTADFIKANYPSVRPNMEAKVKTHHFGRDSGEVKSVKLDSSSPSNHTRFAEVRLKALEKLLEKGMVREEAVEEFREEIEVIREMVEKVKKDRVESGEHWAPDLEKARRLCEHTVDVVFAGRYTKSPN